MAVSVAGSDLVYGSNGSKAEELAAIRTKLGLPSERKTLWEVLDEARQQVHPKARQNKFLQQLAGGGFCNTAYMKYLANLLPIHRALEAAQEALKKSPYLKVYVLEELFRSAAIQRDLVVWEFIADDLLGKKVSPWTPHPSAQEYAEHIRQTAERDPECIVAIMYTLYGTVMSGGQMNKIQISKALEFVKSYTEDVPEGSGVAFFELEHTVAEFKKKWRRKLCKIDKDLPEDHIDSFRSKLISEVHLAFQKILEMIEKDVESGHC